jgi:hypothetical protein
MPDIVVRGRRIGLWILAGVNLVVVVSNADAWLRGHPSLWPRLLTLVPTAFIALCAWGILHPPEARLSGDRVSFRLGLFMKVSTPRANVAVLKIAEGVLTVRFRRLEDVEAGPVLQGILQQNQETAGVHVRIPMKAQEEDVDRLRAAVFAGR